MLWLGGWDLATEINEFAAPDLDLYRAAAVLLKHRGEAPLKQLERAPYCWGQ